MRLSGKVAIVTGASRGLGQAIALAFAREGAKVTVVGRNKSLCDEVVAQISRNGGEAISVQADITSETDVAEMVKQTKDRFGRIDILVNNAGANLPYRVVTEVTLDEWNWILAVNLTGTFLCARAVLPEMMAQRSGKIINLSSIGGRFGAPGRAPYRAAKAGVIILTECLAAEAKEYGIDVNAICAGPMKTDMLYEINAGELPANAMPPEDMAAVVVFLASDESKCITGTTIDAFGAGNPLFTAPPAVQRPT